MFCCYTEISNIEYLFLRNLIEQYILKELITCETSLCLISMH